MACHGNCGVPEALDQLWSKLLAMEQWGRFKQAFDCASKAKPSLLTLHMMHAIACCMLHTQGNALPETLQSQYVEVPFPGWC